MREGEKVGRCPPFFDSDSVVVQHFRRTAIHSSLTLRACRETVKKKKPRFFYWVERTFFLEFVLMGGGKRSKEGKKDPSFFPPEKPQKSGRLFSKELPASDL